MAQPKGKTGNPNGRPVGTPNKATTLAREAIASFVEGNVDRLNGWLDAIAADNPKDAFNCFMDVVEYHIPKLARTEMTGLGGDPIDIRMSDESTARAGRIISEIAKAKSNSSGEKT